MLSLCFISSSKNSFLMSCLKVLMHLCNFISASRLFHVFGPKQEITRGRFTLDSTTSVWTLISTCISTKC